MAVYVHDPGRALHLLYGDEVGVDGAHDPECRKAFPWEENRWDKDLLAYAKGCISLRKEHAALRRGEYKRLHAEGEVMAYSRTYNDETITIAFNVSKEERPFELHHLQNPRVLFGNPVMAENKITIPPRSGIVIK